MQPQPQPSSRPVQAAALGLLWCAALAWPGQASAQAMAHEIAAVDVYGRPTLRLQQDLLPADGRPVQAGDASPQPSRQTMVWTQGRGLQLGLGVVAAQPSERGVAPTLARGVAMAPSANDPAVPTQVLLAAGRQLTPGVDMRLGLGLPLTSSASRAAAGGSLPLAGQAGVDALADPSRQAELRLGMALVPSRAYDGLRRGLAMRVELSGATTVTLKPRGRRLTVQLSSQW